MRTILPYRITLKAKIPLRGLLLLSLLIAKNEMILGQGLMSGRDKVFKYANSSSAYRGLNVHYLEVGGGISQWYLSQQEGMKNKEMPFHLFIEKGKIHSPFSIMASYNFNSAYQLGDFQLTARYASLQAKYSVTRLIPHFPPNINVFGTAGVTGWIADLSNSVTGAVNDTGDIQSEKGLGYVVGAGVSYYLRQFALSAQLLRFSGKGNYIIGDLEEPVPAFTGSTQLNITLSYQFFMGRRKVLCPIYKK